MDPILMSLLKYLQEKYFKDLATQVVYKRGMICVYSSNPEKTEAIKSENLEKWDCRINSSPYLQMEEENYSMFYICRRGTKLEDWARLDEFKKKFDKIYWDYLDKTDLIYQLSDEMFCVETDDPEIVYEILEMLGGKFDYTSIGRRHIFAVK